MDDKKKCEVKRNSSPTRAKVLFKPGKFGVEVEIIRWEGSCAADWSTGKICPWLGTTKSGTREYCLLFLGLLFRKNKLGFLDRCPQCIEAEEEYNKCLRTR